MTAVVVIDTGHGLIELKCIIETILVSYRLQAIAVTFTII